MILDPEQVTTEEVKHWRGLHLLHFKASSCSQKVRILLGEKGIAWESHPVDLLRHAHATPWYLGINPRGVVPVLVHDGVVHVESNDILEYLDALPSEVPPYFPQTGSERQIVAESLALEDDLHMDLRNITMGFTVPAKLAAKPPKVLDDYEKSGASDSKRDKEVAWWRAFAEKGITREQSRASGAAFAGAFETLEKRLSSENWLIGGRISVLEIAWFISIHRVVSAGYPIENHPRLKQHYEGLLRRNSFAREVDMGVQGVALKAYAKYRELTGSSLRHVMA